MTRTRRWKSSRPRPSRATSPAAPPSSSAAATSRRLDRPAGSFIAILAGRGTTILRGRCRRRLAHLTRSVCVAGRRAAVAPHGGPRRLHQRRRRRRHRQLYLLPRRRAATLASISPRYADISQTTPIRIVGSNFAPTGKLYCKFGARPGARSHTVELATTAATFVSVDEVVCESPPAADRLTCGRRRRCASRPTERTTRPPRRRSRTNTSPIVSSVAPTYGDLASADPITVRGAHFFRLPEGGNIACRYSAVADGSWIAAVDFVAEGSYVSVDTLRCAAPTAATGRTVAVAVSVNRSSPSLPCRLRLGTPSTTRPHRRPSPASRPPTARSAAAPTLRHRRRPQLCAHRRGIRLPLWRRGGRGDLSERPGGALRAAAGGSADDGRLLRH